MTGEPVNDASAPALQADGLQLQYPGAGTVFEAVSLAVQRREIVVLLGPSGCGKSSLLRVLSGLEHGSGELRFLGEPLRQPHPRAALVFQQASLLPWLNVEANVAFGLDFKHQPVLPAATRRERVSRALAAVGLADRARAYPSALSGGMAQRVALARALAREPALLFADEPFSALDAVTRGEMQALLVQLVRRWQAAALLVTHDLDEAVQVADRILLMGGRPGRILREWAVPLSQPRDPLGPAAAALRAEVLAALHDSAARTALATAD